MRKLTSYFLIVLMYVFSSIASGNYSSECSSASNDIKKINRFYEKAKEKGSYNKVRNLWKALNCKYPGRGKNPSGKTRKLVVFLDGTWNDHKTYTNIWQLYNLALEHSRENPIIPYYDKGVGSHKNDLISGGLTGKGISKDIRQAYRFLVEAYEPGDEIYIFGFSRGAITARSLNGMIKFVGLLKEESFNNEESRDKLLKRLVSDLYNGYHLAPIENEEIGITIGKKKDKVIEKYYGKKYKKHFGVINFWQVQVEVIGVFDTVACLGSKCVTNPKKHHTDLYAKKGFHALAIDEVRGMFAPLRFDPDKNEGILEEKWFSGGHSDVGGGYDSNYTTTESCDIERICGSKSDKENEDRYYYGLETISLNWMIDKIKDKDILSLYHNFPECYIGKLHTEYFKKRLIIVDQIGKKFVGYLPREIKKEDSVSSNVKKRFDSKCLFDAHPKYEKNNNYNPSNYKKYLLSNNKGR